MPVPYRPSTAIQEPAMALMEHSDSNGNAPASWRAPEMIITYGMFAFALVPAILAIIFSQL